jgi:multiple antibiotic resistance protein
LNHSEYILAIIPIFVALDAIGVLPIFIGITSRYDERARAGLLRQSILTALAVSLTFLFAGKFIFMALGITPADFKIGGGAILLVIAINDLIFEDGHKLRQSKTLGVVPIGTPLIAGPAVLTTLILLVDTYGTLPALVSLVVNILFTWFVFSRSAWIQKVLGEGGAKGFAKVMSILLAAIAVMMVRKGVYDLIAMK